MCHTTHKLLVIGEYLIRLPFTECAMLLTAYCSQGKMWWDCCSQNVWCHLLSVNHEKRCNGTPFHKMCNITHSLLVIRKDGWGCLSLENVQCHSQAVGHKRCNICNCLAQNVQCHLLAVGHEKRYDVTVQFHSQAVGHKKRCDENHEISFHNMCSVTYLLWIDIDETTFHNVCNVTYFLSIIGKDVVRLPSITCAISLTSCWS